MLYFGGREGGEGVHCGKVSVKSNPHLFLVLEGQFAYLYFPIRGIDGRGDRACNAIGEICLPFCLFVTATMNPNYDWVAIGSPIIIIQCNVSSNVSPHLYNLWTSAELQRESPGFWVLWPVEKISHHDLACSHLQIIQHLKQSTLSEGAYH